MQEITEDKVELPGLQVQPKLHRTAWKLDDIVGDDTCPPGVEAEHVSKDQEIRVDDEGCDIVAEGHDAGHDAGDHAGVPVVVPQDSIAGDDDGAAEPYSPPRRIGNVWVSQEIHQNAIDAGLRVRCGICKSRKFAALFKDPFAFGPRAAEICLGAWLAYPCRNDGSHSSWKPGRDEQEAYLRTLT